MPDSSRHERETDTMTGAWHLLLNASRTRRIVRGSVDPLPDGWTQVASYDAGSYDEAVLIGRHLAPWNIVDRRYVDPREVV